MKRRELAVHRRELRAALLSETRGRVFHVTCGSNVASILADGRISASADASVARPFGQYTSYYRQRGCVSLFDYRTVTTEQLKYALDSCAPDQASSSCDDGTIAVFFLRESAFEQIDYHGNPMKRVDQNSWWSGTSKSDTQGICSLAQ